MVKCAIGLDFGTSSIKGMVLTEKEEVVLKDGISIEYGTDTHPDGATYISLDPRMVYDRMCQLIKRFLAQLPADHKVVAMSFACASGNTLLCDKNGEPLMNAYSWLNPSYKEESLPILGPIDKEASRAISGWGFGGTFPMGHLSHLKLHNPELYAKAGKVCMVGEYINHRLTGKWGLDRSTATPFFFAEQETGKYHKEYLDAFGFTEDMLPPLGNTGDVLGKVTAQAAKDTGLDEGTTIVLGSFDSPAAARGNDVLKEGEFMISCGTSWVACFPVKDRQRLLKWKALVDPFQEHIGGNWIGLLSLAQTSIYVDKIVTKYISAGEDRPYLYDAAAEAAEPGAGGLRINPETDCDKDFSGWSKENIARATMEGTAYALKDMLKPLEADGMKFTSAVMAGGPSNSKIWTKIVSEILGIPVTAKYKAYSGAAGAAKIALGLVK